MSFDTNDIRSQLAPGWSGVNIAILVVLFIIAWPLGLLMLAYILGGRSVGLDLSRPQTFTDRFARLSAAFSAGLAEFSRDQQPDGSAAAPEDGPSTRSDPAREPSDAAPASESDGLRAEREAFESEKRQFAEEKEAFRRERDRN